VAVTSVTDTSLSVTWQRPRPVNGVIQQYRVFYWRTDTNTSIVQLLVSASQQTYNMTSLHPATTYSVQVPLALVCDSTSHCQLRVLRIIFAVRNVWHHFASVTTDIDVWYSADGWHSEFRSLIEKYENIAQGQRSRSNVTNVQPLLALTMGHQVTSISDQ